MRHFSGVGQAIKDKIMVHMVFSMQEARNLAMKAKLLIQEQTCISSYRGYGGVRRQDSQ